MDRFTQLGRVSFYQVSIDERLIAEMERIDWDTLFFV